VEEDAPAADALQVRHACEHKRFADASASMLRAHVDTPDIADLCSVYLAKGRIGSRHEIAALQVCWWLTVFG
jgi:hypothetical protein